MQKAKVNIFTMTTTLGARIRQARKVREMTQAELARDLGMNDQSPLSKIERSPTQTTSSYVGRIAEVLQVRVSWLLYGTGPMDSYGTGSDTVDTPDDPDDMDAMLYQAVDRRCAHAIGGAVADLPTVAVARSVLESEGVAEAEAIGYVQSDQSMSPTLTPGDKGIIDHARRDPSEESGALYAVVRGRTVIARRIVAYTDGRAILSCDSPDKRLYPDEHFDSLDNLVVLGRIVWSCGRK